MNKKVVGIIGIILSILTLLYFEPLVYKVIGFLGININKYSSLIRTIINILIKLTICFIIYLIYKKNFRHHRQSENLLKNILILLVGLVVLVIAMYLFDYVVRFIGDIFKIKVLDNAFYNIFNKTFNFDLIVKIIIDYIITPYLYCTIILFSIDSLTRRNDTFIFFSGILAGVINAFSLNRTLGFVIVNSLSMFFLFLILAFVYKKINSIWFTISLYSFYLLTSAIIINYLGW